MSEILLLLLLLGFSAFFSGAETALVALSRGRADSLGHEKRSGARALRTLKANPQRMLVAILIGNNIANISASALATVIATREFGSAGPGVAIGLLTIVILVFGEITPKSLATRYSERISLVVAPVILGLVYLTAPIGKVFEHMTAVMSKAAPGSGEDPLVTESELISMAGYGEEEGTIEESEKQLIERAFAFSDLAVSDVMTPRHKVFRLPEETSADRALHQLVDTPFSRIPLYRADPDEVTGILHVRDLLSVLMSENTKTQIGELARRPYFVPDRQTLTDTISALRQERHQLAVVVDEHGVMEGVVSLEDLLEELVGEIYDESDIAPLDLTVHGPDLVTVEGALELRVLSEYFELALSGKPTDSVSRWILKHVQRIPCSGEEFALDGLKLTVKRATPRRIHEVLVAREPDTASQLGLKYPSVK